MDLATAAMHTLERRRRRRPHRRPSFHVSPFRSSSGQITVLGIVVAVIGFMVFLTVCAFIFFTWRALRRKRIEGKPPRWGRIILKSLAVGSIIFIPLLLIAKCRSSSSKKDKGKYAKIDEHNAWYGAAPPPGAANIPMYANPSSTSYSATDGTPYDPATAYAGAVGEKRDNSSSNGGAAYMGYAGAGSALPSPMPSPQPSGTNVAPPPPPPYPPHQPPPMDGQQAVAAYGPPAQSVSPQMGGYAPPPLPVSPMPQYTGYGPPPAGHQ